MKRIEREKVIRNAYRSTILALTICCIFLGAVLVIHELAREYEVSKLNKKLDAKGVVQNDEGLYASVQLFLPEKIYVAQGVTLELYNSQVSSLGTRIEDYNVKWTCAVGKNMQRNSGGNDIDHVKDCRRPGRAGKKFFTADHRRQPVLQYSNL